MGDDEAARVAWIKKGVLAGLNLEAKFFDDLLRHPTEGPQLKAFLKEPARGGEWTDTAGRSALRTRQALGPCKGPFTAATARIDRKPWRGRLARACNA